MAALTELTAFTETWDETTIQGSQDANLIDNYMQEFKRAIRERLARDHYVYATETGKLNLGAHTVIHLLTQTATHPSALVNAGCLYTLDVSGVSELHFKDENEAVTQLTAAGKLNITSLGMTGMAKGDIIYADSATTFTRLAVGTTGQRLYATSGGIPGWTNSNCGMLFYVKGTLSVETNASAQIRCPMTGTITKVYADVKTAPTGTTIIVDINKGGTSIWATNQGNRVQIAVGATSGNQTSFDTTAVTEGDLFTVDVDQIGSLVAGTTLSVVVVIKEA